MPSDEIRLRLRQEAAKRVDRLVYGLGFKLSSLELRPARETGKFNSRRASPGEESSAEPQPRAEPLKPPAARGSGQFFFPTSEVQPILAILRERFPDECGKIVERAERICHHQFDLLGFQNVNFGQEIDWHLDPVHQQRAPRRPWYQGIEAGDPRIILEINRHQHLVTLAMALLLEPQTRYLAELLGQWRGWQKENRYPIGINWSSGHEAALRSMVWLWVGHLLSACALAPRSFQHELLRGLAENGRHIERYLRPGSASQIGQATGLFFIGALCPRLRSAARWQELGWRLIQEEAQKRVRPDGMHRDDSVYGHVYALDFFLHARILAAANQIPIPEFLDGAIVRMLELLAGISQGGFPPRLGDDDGGRVFDPSRNRGVHMLDPLSTGAALYGRADFKSASPGLTEETLWLLGPEGVSRFDAIANRRAPPSSTAFCESGLYVMTGGTPPRLLVNARSPRLPPQAVIAAGAPNRGAHGHDDSLSLHLSTGGEEWLIDPGTFTCAGFGAPIAAGSSCSERYAGAAAHNRLVVDGGSPHKASDAVELLASAAPLWSAGRQFDLFRGTDSSRDGAGNPVVRERWVFQLKSEFWLVRDVALGTDEHELEIFWHFAPGFTPAYTPPGFTLSRQGRESADAGLAIVPSVGHGWSQEIFRGYVSPVYGAEGPAAVVCFRTKARLPAEMAVILTPSEAKGMGRLKRGCSGDVTSYRYSKEGSLYLFFFQHNASQWECGGWRSDARFVLVGLTPRGASNVLVDGSYLNFRGRPVLVSDRPVRQCEVTPEGDEVVCLDPQATVKFHGFGAAIEEAAGDFPVRQ